MKLIEEEIRMLLRAKVSEAPVKDEPPQLVLRRTRTLRVVNGITATAAAAAVVIAIVIGAQSLGGRRGPVPPVAPGGQVVPWLPLPAAANNAVLNLKPPPDRPCSSNDIASLFVARWGVGFSPANGNVACQIDPHDDRFKVVLREIIVARGELLVTVRVADTAPTLFVDGKKTHDAGLMFTWNNYCGAQSKEVRFDVTLPGGGTIASTGAGVVPPCVRPGEPSTLTFDALGTMGASMRDDQASVENLAVSVSAPATVGRGQTLIYRVRLFNFLDRDVPLDPCPGYAQGLQQGDFDAVLGGYRLNCEGVRGKSIPAGGSVEFEMQMRVPIDHERGEWMLFWIMDPFQSTPATSVINVL